MSLSWGGGTFLPNFQTKLKYDKISVYLVKITELCINKYFTHVKTLDIVLNPINLAYCGSQKDIPVTPSRTADSNDRLKLLLSRCHCQWGGGGLFCQIFRQT